ncbi:hypothetical protein [Flavobacterium nackdongense]|uniref:hypothetical protein n=1 Tax=Flavobacterium nackdongense TaxID=2547394 RepID=UPI0013FCF779|nr:hypothetical protein [Flavobacterium nackdongense]
MQSVPILSKVIIEDEIFLHTNPNAWYFIIIWIFYLFLQHNLINEEYRHIKNIPGKPNQCAYNYYQKEDSDKFIASVDVKQPPQVVRKAKITKTQQSVQFIFTFFYN